MKRRGILGAIVATTLSAGSTAAMARGTVQAVDYDNRTWRSGTGRPMTQEAVRQAIIRAGQAASWKIDDDGPGSVRATFWMQRKHMIRTRIAFSAASFSVRYDDSENMKHWVSTDGRNLIHPHYNAWTEKLVTAITAELERA